MYHIDVTRQSFNKGFDFSLGLNNQYATAGLQGQAQYYVGLLDIRRIGEFYKPFKTPLRIQGFTLFYAYIPKKCQKIPAIGLGLDLQVYYCGFPYDQGQ